MAVIAKGSESQHPKFSAKKQIRLQQTGLRAWLLRHLDPFGERTDGYAYVYIYLKTEGSHLPGGNHEPNLPYMLAPRAAVRGFGIMGILLTFTSAESWYHVFQPLD